MSITSQYPYRSVQIVLRLYHSPAEVLAGFDVDSCSFGFDGEQVLATPRAVAAALTQTNTIDLTRRSPSYEVRLAKYADRGYEIFVPDLDRSRIDPSIYERGASGVVGLARLLVLEKFANLMAKEAYTDAQREVRARPERTWEERARLQRSAFGGNLRNDAATRSGWIQTSTYDSVVVTVPYGPKWDAARIQKLLYKTDVVANSRWNPKNKDFKGLHRHAAFFGRMEDVLQDCCQLCPAAATPEELEAKEKIGDAYVSGALR